MPFKRRNTLTPHVENQVALAVSAPFPPPGDQCIPVGGNQWRAQAAVHQLIAFRHPSGEFQAAIQHFIGHFHAYERWRAGRHGGRGRIPTIRGVQGSLPAMLLHPAETIDVNTAGGRHGVGTSCNRDNQQRQESVANGQFPGTIPPTHPHPPGKSLHPLVQLVCKISPQRGAGAIQEIIVHYSSSFHKSRNRLTER